MLWIIPAIMAGSAIADWWSKRQQAKQQEKAGQRAGQTALGGFNYLQGSPIGQQYLPAGGAAAQQQAALLGVGGADGGGAQAAYQNYLNSVGYQGQMAAGQQAITSSRAAQGLLGSGSTGKALVRFGDQLGRENFNNYLAQLHGVAGQGLQAGGMLGQAATQGYGQAAGYQYGAGQDAVDSRSNGWEQLMGGLGTAYDAWRAGRPAQPTALNPRFDPNRFTPSGYRPAPRIGREVARL